MNLPAHISTFLQQHETSLEGLSSDKAQTLFQEYGSNSIQTKKPKHWYHYLANQFLDLMVIILIVAVLISFMVGERSDAMVILGIVFLNAIIGFIQEYKADKALEALKAMISPTAKVFRDGEMKEILREHIVPGDIIKLEEGDKVPADAVIVEGFALEIDEAILTGESTSVNKEILDEDGPDKHNTVFMGTLVAQGEALAMVTATGHDSEFGKIAHLTVSTKKDKSPLQIELKRIGVFVAKVTVLISTILFVAGMFQGKEIAENFLFAVSVAVAAVPEGLPATVTIALAIGVQRLAKKRAIIKQLTSVETLGSTTVICSDKTGTLTKNQMTVTKIWTPSFTLDVEGAGYKPVGDITIQDDSAKDTPISELNNESYNKQIETMTALFEYCNNAGIEERDGQYIPIGDPTEVALKVFNNKQPFTIPAFEKTDELPFNSKRKYMSVTGRLASETDEITLIKGAPEVVMHMATHIETAKGAKQITDSFRKDINAESDVMSEAALRVLGLAKKQGNDVVFLGLVGMIDPPRPEVAEAMKLTEKAGIKTIIITGDYVKTARAIAKEVGMKVDDSHTMLGSELDNMEEAEIAKLFTDNKSWLFSRVNPVHKMKIVSALKLNGEVVAVTGDGVNDAPALKRADIGVAMGITGTEVSKEAANMILVDDSFATIVSAIGEGRTIYDNMKKFVYYVFSSNSAELFAIFSALIFNFPAPLTAVLILSVDLGTDILPSLALGVDTADKDIMKRPPRDIEKKIMDKPFVLRLAFIGLVIGTISVAIFLYILHSYGWEYGQSLAQDDYAYLKGTTAAFATLILLQLVNSYMARNKSRSVFKLNFFENKHLIAAIFASGLMMVSMVHVPFLNDILHTVPLNFAEWAIIIGGAILVLILEESRKYIATRYVRN